MKYKIAIILFLITIAKTSAQRERVINLPTFDDYKFHYGFYLGANRNTFRINYKLSSVDKPNITIEPTIGFNIGLIGDARLHKNINLRFEPGLISNSKAFTFEHIEGKAFEQKRRVGSTYLHLPLIFKFSTDRIGNFRPYVLAGGSYDYNFSSNEESSDDNFSGKFRQNSNAYMYELGIGIDIYLPYFKFSPSIRGIFAINNEIKYDNRSPSKWTDPVDFMGTRGLFIHLAFE